MGKKIKDLIKDLLDMAPEKEAKAEPSPKARYEENFNDQLRKESPVTLEEMVVMLDIDPSDVLTHVIYHKDHPGFPGGRVYVRDTSGGNVPHRREYKRKV